MKEVRRMLIAKILSKQTPILMSVPLPSIISLPPSHSPHSQTTALTVQFIHGSRDLGVWLPLSLTPLAVECK